MCECKEEGEAGEEAEVLGEAGEAGGHLCGGKGRVFGADCARVASSAPAKIHKHRLVPCSPVSARPSLDNSSAATLSPTASTGNSSVQPL